MGLYLHEKKVALGCRLLTHSFQQNVFWSKHWSCFANNLNMKHPSGSYWLPDTWSIYKHKAAVMPGDLWYVFCLSFFFISTNRLSSDDNLGSEGHACLGQDLLLHVPVIVSSSISNFRGENGVGLKRQLLIDLQKFKFKKANKKLNRRQITADGLLPTQTVFVFAYSNMISRY